MPPLWVPSSATAKYKCDICGAQFYPEEEEKWARHVARCARKHNDDLLEAAEHHRRSQPLADAVDQEAVAFQVKRYGPG